MNIGTFGTFLLRWTPLSLRVHAHCKTGGTERYNMDWELVMSPIMVPSQYRDANNVPIDNPDMQF